ncbi:2-hydroxyacid dehydrogenase [Kordiimonas aestuarii]|uniref:2-hydroxyacid dehydrogenase n=1 Tax=Kordiimonas aestuarii TaxID=1005925 RepID=UPI0021D3E30E|nr:glyoxylate/hydroxypyruvate reductase A [Kordiimonas aestuarii]
MTRILFYLEDYSHDIWREAVRRVDPSVEFRSHPDWGSPDDGPAYAFVWEPEPGLLARYSNIKAIFSLGAGVDHLTRDPDLPKDVPIIRMGDDGLKEGMAEFVTMSVLMHQRGMPALLAKQRSKDWGRFFARAAKDTRVGILGFGALGQVSAQALLPFGYDIAAWSRTEKPEYQGISLYHGADSLNTFLARTDILVGLLPSTPETSGLMNFDRLSHLPEGASIVNAGRGSLIVLDDLMSLLTSGYLSGATLDVFPEEPLAKDHALWGLDNVIITPHIAAITRPDTAAEYVLRNIEKLERGETAENQLDMKRGY